MPKIRVYGGEWCADCRVTKDFLDKNNLEYEYIDLGKNPDKIEEMEKINGGLQIIPTVVLPDGKFLLEPNSEVLKKALEESAIL